MFSIFTTETGELDLDQAAQAVQRCTAAYFRVMESLSKRADLFKTQEVQQQALKAFLAELPLLLGIHSIQVYIACLSRARDIGAIDAGDVGHYLYPAQIAMQAWKLANPPQRRQREMNTHPPSKGNHAAAEQSPAAPSEGEQWANIAAKSGQGTQEQLPPTPSKGNQPTPHEAGRQTTANAQSTAQPTDSTELLRSGLPLPTDYVHPNPAIQQAIQPAIQPLAWTAPKKDAAA